MDKVKAKFKQYNLKEIVKEYRESCSTDQEQQVTLPRTVGGSEVHLLLGIKNTQLVPGFEFFGSEEFSIAGNPDTISPS